MNDYCKQLELERRAADSAVAGGGDSRGVAAERVSERFRLAGELIFGVALMAGMVLLALF